MVDTQHEVKEWGMVVWTFLERLGERIGTFLPNLIGAILIILVGWVVAKFLRGLTTKLLGMFGIVSFGEKIKLNEILHKFGISRSLDHIIGTLIYYMVLLVFFLSASEVLGLTVVLETLNSFIAYVPHVLGAFLILVIALYLAKVIKDGATSASTNLNIAYAGALSSFLEILIIGFGIVMALTELGLDMTVFTANITVIIAGVVLAMALSIGLGSRSIMANVLARYYIAQLYHVGDEVLLAGEKGIIRKVTPVSVVIQTEHEETLHIPNEQIIAEGSKKRRPKTEEDT
ncbi:mechanosensitive ion channel family protein [Nitrospira sp. M1]